jgi:hypothetical protein
MKVLARYHGSLVNFHGNVLVEGPSSLRKGTFRLVALDRFGSVLEQVRPESFTALAIDFGGGQEEWFWIDEDAWGFMPDPDDPPVTW